MRKHVPVEEELCPARPDREAAPGPQGGAGVRLSLGSRGLQEVEHVGVVQEVGGEPGPVLPHLLAMGQGAAQPLAGGQQGEQGGGGAWGGSSWTWGILTRMGWILVRRD